jgi:nitronate monooxygenase
MALPVEWSQRLRLPLLVAPMLHISSPELVAQACLAGAMAAFPTANCANTTELSAWIVRIRSLLTSSSQTGGYLPAPFAANLIIKSPHVQAHLDCLVEEGIELVITSVGSPRDVIGPLHRAGCRVFADVASVAHAHKALNDGVDGLVLLSAGAGGQTGWANGFAFVRAVRDFYDGPVALAGGLGDGASLWAAQALGADLGYMGTRFIATPESLASSQYRDQLVSATLDDVVLSSAVTGLPANWLRHSLADAGLLSSDAADFDPERFTARDADAARRWKDVWSAGHSVSSVDAVAPTAVVIAGLLEQYRSAREASLSATCLHVSDPLAEVLQ